MSIKAELECSFCGKHHDEVQKIISSPVATVLICDECVMVCLAILMAEGLRLDGMDAPQMQGLLAGLDYHQQLFAVSYLEARIKAHEDATQRKD